VSLQFAVNTVTMVSLTPEVLANLLEFPIQAPPPGVTPNFVNPDSSAYQIYITAAVCIVLMLFFTVARLVAKISLRQKFLLGDEIVFYAGLVSALFNVVVNKPLSQTPTNPSKSLTPNPIQFFCIAFIGMTVACVSGGAFGRDAWNVVLGAFTKSQLVLALLIETELPIAICLVKCSVLMLYYHVFRVLTWMRIISIISMVVVITWHVSLAIAFAVMCSPSTGDGQLDFLAAFVSDSCTKTRILVVLQGAGNVVTDIFLVILPLPAVWTLRLPLSRKLAISAMFSVGLTAVASSIIGLVYRYHFYVQGDNNIRLAVALWVTSMTEEAAGIMICCMPATAVVFKSVKGPLKSWLSSVSERTLRLTGSSAWSRSKLSENQDSNYRSGGSNGSAEKVVQGGQGNDGGYYQHGVYCHPSQAYRHDAWVDTEVDSWSIHQLNPGHGGIGKRSDIEVTRMV
jgi:hypothetical protein